MAADLNLEWICSLPRSWTYGITRGGRVFFINEEAKSTTWLHPVTGEAVVTGHRRQSTGRASRGCGSGPPGGGWRCFGLRASESRGAFLLRLFISTWKRRPLHAPRSPSLPRRPPRAVDAPLARIAPVSAPGTLEGVLTRSPSLLPVPQHPSDLPTGWEEAYTFEGARYYIKALSPPAISGSQEQKGEPDIENKTDNAVLKRHLHEGKVQLTMTDSESLLQIT
ncbi:hypothetical protein U0070_004942 [Myodes glareolus]|uniref:WW domain-containing protein n=1 Tax=Myodes glareolus TaxID=447135 RepID=A0AAW0K7C5_MYOGA